jgi:hypothetical protein
MSIPFPDEEMGWNEPTCFSEPLHPLTRTADTAARWTSDALDLSLDLAIAVAVVGLVGLVYKLRADSIGQAVEDLTTELTDRSMHIPLLAELAQDPSEDISFRPGMWWTRNDLEENVFRWSHRYRGRLGPRVRMLLFE